MSFHVYVWELWYMHGPMWRATLEYVKQIKLRDMSAHALPDAHCVIALWRITFMLRKVLISVSEWPWQRDPFTVGENFHGETPSHKTYTCQYLLHISALTVPSSGRTLYHFSNHLLIVRLLQWLSYRAWDISYVGFFFNKVVYNYKAILSHS